MTRSVLDDLLSELRRRNTPVPKPRRRATEADVGVAEQELGIQSHDDYRAFLLAAGDVVYGTTEPLTAVQPDRTSTSSPRSRSAGSDTACRETCFPSARTMAT